MKINLNHVFKTLEGEDIITPKRVTKDGETKTIQESFTLKAACINSLMQVSAQDKLTGEEKVYRATLAEDIFRSDGEIDLQIDDIKLLKDLIGEMGSPLIVKQAWDILDPATKN